MKALVLSACIGLSIGTLVAVVLAYRAVCKQPPQLAPLTAYGHFVDNFGNDPRLPLPEQVWTDFGN